VGVLVLVAAAGPVAAQSSGNISAPALAYTETAGGPVHLVDEDGDTVDTGVRANIIGPVADMDQDGTLDVTAVNDNGDIILIPAVSGATATTLATGATKQDPASRTIAIGDIDDDGTLAVLYANQNDGNFLYRVEPGGSPQLVYGGEETKGALGHGDFTNDGTDETVFRGSSGQIKWVDDSGTVGDTGTSNYGSNNGIGLGPLADYNGDGMNRVSAITGSNVPALIDSNGDFDRPDENYQAASKAPVAAADVTGDGSLEIMHRNTNTGSIYYMTTGGTSAEYTPGGSGIAVSDEQGLSGTGVASRLDATAADYTPGPSVTVDRPVDGENYTSSDVPLDASADETSDWSYSVDGGANQTATGANGTRTLNTTLSGLAEGQHDVTVYAETSSGVGTASASFTVDTTSPSISSFNASNPDAQDVSVSFDSDEDLSNISVDLSGPESATLTEADFVESGGTYSATYDGNSDGDYTATLETAEDAAGNDGAAGQSDDTTVDTTAPTISSDSFSASNPDGQNVSVSFDSDEDLSNISVDLSGPESTTLTEADFVESGGTYTATYDGNSDGDYTATLDTAEDAAGNDGATGQSDTTTVDTTAPSISSFTASNPDGQNVSVSFDSDEQLETVSVDLSGPESATLTEADFVESGGTYSATYDGNSDGDYTATLETAEDAAGNDGAAGQSDDTTVDSIAPSISSFTASNPDGQNVSVSFDSDEDLSTVNVDLAGPEDATLTEADFVESGGTYTATYDGNSDGEYTATLETAEDAAGNDGAAGQSDTTTVDTTAPTISSDSVTASNPEGQNVSVSFDSDEQLETISVDLAGPEDATLTEADFTESGGTYSATYDGNSEGDYTATLETAEDAAGNDGAAGQSDTATVDSIAPTIYKDSFTATNPDGQNVSVSFDSDEQLETISVDLSGPESATLTESDFVESGGTYSATYDGNSDGEYTATLETAEDAAGNDGAAGQTDTTTVDTTAPTISGDSFTASNPDGQNVSVSFDSDEDLSNVSVDLVGPEDATLTEADFVESGGTYTATYDGNSDGDYTATLDTAEDAAGNDGAAGQSDTTTVDTTAPPVTVAEPTDGESYAASEVPLDVTADESVADWTYSLDGGANESFTPNATLSGLADGPHNLTVYAEDDAGNVRPEAVDFTVDTVAPTVPNESFTVTGQDDQNVSVTIDSDERLENISVDVTGPENATLTEANFTEDNGTYNATYEAETDGEYNATLETAEDAAGNDGAAGQTGTTTVDTSEFSYDRFEDGFGDGRDTASDREETIVDARGVSPDAAATDRPPAAFVNVSNPEPGQTLLVNGTEAAVRRSGTSVDENAPENETVLADGDDEPVEPILPDRLVVETNTSDDYELTVRTYTDDLAPSRTLMAVDPEPGRTEPPEDAEAIRSAAASFESETDTVAAGYVRINTTLAAGEVDGATFRFSIRRAYLEERGVDPGNVTLYRQVDDGEWMAMQTTSLDTVEGYHRYETEMAAVSMLALGTGTPRTAVTNASLEETTIETGETAVVTATLTNRGRTATEETVRVTRDGETLDEATVELEGNETRTVTFAFTPESAGEYDLSVGSIDLETLTVEPGGTATGDGETATDGDGPGFGVGLALAALCVAGYVLRRRDGPG
jgi:PGF-CTERM protein